MGQGAAPARPHAHLQVHRRDRAVGDARRVPARRAGRAGEAGRPRASDSRAGPGGVHLRGGADHARLAELRPPSHLGQPEQAMTGDQTPKARVRRRRVLRLIWIVPVMAIAVAVYLVWYRMQDYGPQITVTFNDGAGLRVGQTPVRYRVVQVGEVSGVTLSDDEKKALVRIRLLKSGAGIAREGSQFWIVRPRVGFGQITGLTTVLSGPEINVTPGSRDNPSKTEFAGLETPPSAIEGGLRIVLRAERPKMRADAPVYYRGVEVGVVQKLDLAPNALSADVHVVIYPRFAALVREGSSFWDVSGLNIK